MKRVVTSILGAILVALSLAACGKTIHSAQVVTTENGDQVEIWCENNTFHSKPVRQSVEYATQGEVTEPNSPYCKGSRMANDPTRDSWFDYWLYSSLFTRSPYYGSYIASPPPQRTIVQVVNDTPARTAAPTVKPTTKPTTKATTKPTTATFAPPNPSTRIPDNQAPPAPTAKVTTKTPTATAKPATKAPAPAPKPAAAPKPAPAPKPATKSGS